MAISLSLIWSGNVSYRLVRNDLELASVDAIAEAGLNRAVAGLLDPRPDRRWPTDNVAQRFEFEGKRMTISIQDELGKIDLNQAETPLLVGLLKSVGLDFESASSLAYKILDWRTATPLKHLNGAKDQEYRESGSAYRPRNGPFQSVDELLLVKDMNPALFKRIEPALTVYSGHQFVDPRVAPREVLRALPNMTPDLVEAQLAARASPTRTFELLGKEDQNAFWGHAFTIRVKYASQNKTVEREATIRLTNDPAKLYWLLSWRTP